MSADYGRIHRLLKILTLIQGERGWNPKRLARECQTTERSIYRDMKMLQGAGVPYAFDKQTNGYIIGGNFFMPAVSLTLEESLALIALAEHVGGREQVPFTGPALKAISKVRCNLPRQVQRELEQLDRHVELHLAAAATGDGTEDVYECIRQAIAGRRALRCAYDSLSNSGGDSHADGEPFRFEPYALYFGQRAWYAVGHHSGRKAVRTLKLSRFSLCQLTHEPFEIPKSFSLKKHLGNAWRMIRGGQTYDVELYFDPQFAETIGDTHWHDTQQLQWQPDGSLVFQCTVDGLDEIIWWVLSMGPHCVVRKPRELIQRVRQFAEEMVQCYEKPRKQRSRKP